MCTAGGPGNRQPPAAPVLDEKLLETSEIGPLMNLLDEWGMKGVKKNQAALCLRVRFVSCHMSAL